MFPRVPNLEKIDAEKLAGGFYRIIAHHGFMETPKMETILALAREKGVDIKFENASFFLGQEKLIIGDKPKMGKMAFLPVSIPFQKLDGCQFIFRHTFQPGD